MKEEKKKSEEIIKCLKMDVLQLNMENFKIKEKYDKTTTETKDRETSLQQSIKFWTQQCNDLKRSNQFLNNQMKEIVKPLENMIEQLRTEIQILNLQNNIAKNKEETYLSELKTLQTKQGTLSGITTNVWKYVTKIIK